MRARIRRIDLTQSPVTFELWPRVDWLEPVAPVARPRGRTGLWNAMANAVAIAVESSAPVERAEDDALVIELAREAPHLAYLARVAAAEPAFADGDDAEIIAFGDARANDRS